MMSLVNSFISPYVIAILSAWIIAHLIKYVASRNSGSKMSLGQHVFRSGGMPSAHTTTAVSVVTVIGWVDGVSSSVFGLGLMVSMIIAYDSMKLRKSSGQQGEALLELLKQAKTTKAKLPVVVKGHTPKEVAVGVLLGVVIGTVVFFATL